MSSIVLELAEKVLIGRICLGVAGRPVLPWPLIKPKQPLEAKLTFLCSHCKGGGQAAGGQRTPLYLEWGAAGASPQDRTLGLEQGRCWETRGEASSVTLCRKSKGRLGLKNRTFISVVPLTQAAIKSHRVWFFTTSQMSSPPPQPLSITQVFELVQSLLGHTYDMAHRSDGIFQ